MTHGLRSERALVLSDPPAGSRHIKRDVTTLRRKLEAAAEATHGALTLTLESQINLACRAEIRALLAAKWLRDAKADLSPSEKLAMINAVAEATKSRDDAIRALRLDVPPQEPDPLVSLYNGAVANRFGVGRDAAAYTAPNGGAQESTQPGANGGPQRDGE
jgi:hypothetical protein